ncbi:hypothetical protein D3C84_1009350 [compost metagenome]
MLLPGLQALTFDTHRGGAGYRLQKCDAIRAEFFQITAIAAIGQQKHQQPHGFVMTIVQADADQVHSGTGHREQHFVQIACLFETEIDHHVVGA